MGNGGSKTAHVILAIATSIAVLVAAASSIYIFTSMKRSPAADADITPTAAGEPEPVRAGPTVEELIAGYRLALGKIVLDLRESEIILGRRIDLIEKYDPENPEIGKFRKKLAGVIAEREHVEKRIEKLRKAADDYESDLKAYLEELREYIEKRADGADGGDGGGDGGGEGDNAPPEDK